MEGRKFIKTVRKIGTSIVIDIPEEIIDLAGIENGDMLEVTILKIKKGVI